VARLTLYLLREAVIWQLTFADDLEWSVQGPDMMIHLALAIYFQVVMGVPFSWPKFGGGTSFEWVGYFQDYNRFAIGISETRAAWLASWCKATLLAGGVRVYEMEEVLGRLGFSANALWHIRPWLGPLYAWVSATPSGCYLALPVLIQLILATILKEMNQGPAMASLLDTEDDNQRIFRADAMASEVRVGIGGWEEEQGRPAQQSPWFAEEVTEEDAPWLFREGIGQAFRKIAALEMIATTACVRLFGNSEGHQGKTIKMVGETDNKGNSHVIAKLLTTKFPLCAVLMQLTIDLGRRGIDLDLAWVPREENVLADALSNGVTEGMDPSLRRRFSIKDLSTLTQLLEAGELPYGEVTRLRGEEFL